MIRRTLALAAVLLLSLATAAHAGTPGAGEGGSVDDTTLDRGQTTTFRGQGCPPNTPVTITMNGRTVGSGQTDAQGRFAIPFTVPNDTSPGQHQVVARDATGDCVFTVTVTVLGAAAQPARSGALPRTGDDTSLPLAKLAAGLVAAGGFLVLATRKRSRSRGVSASA